MTLGHVALLEEFGDIIEINCNRESKLLELYYIKFFRVSEPLGQNGTALARSLQ